MYKVTLLIVANFHSIFVLRIISCSVEWIGQMIESPLLCLKSSKIAVFSDEQNIFFFFFDSFHAMIAAVFWKSAIWWYENRFCQFSATNYLWLWRYVAVFIDLLCVFVHQRKHTLIHSSAGWKNSRLSKSLSLVWDIGAGKLYEGRLRASPLFLYTYVSRRVKKFSPV